MTTPPVLPAASQRLRLVPEAAGDSPRYTAAALDRVRDVLELVNDLADGPRAMWAKRSQYLPKWKHEEDDVYRIRALGEPCFGGFKRTLVAGVGMLWGREPAIAWGPHEDEMKALWDNIDNAGTKGHVFGARLTRSAIREGFALILVDHPSAPRDEQGRPRAVTAADEQRLNLRPFWTFYARSAVLNWRTQLVNNQTVVSQLTLHEPTELDDGAFGQRTVHRFRVLSVRDGRAGYELWEEQKAADGTLSYEKVSEGVYTNATGQTRASLPIAIAYAGTKNAALDADVPLEGVAYANLSHWQLASDLTFNRKVCGFEQIVVTGELRRNPNTPVEETELRIGPLVGLHLEQGGDVKWAAPSGGGLAQLEKAVREKLEQMDSLGLGFLIPRQQVQATATEARIESYAQLASLATAGQGIEDAINLAWEHTCWYYDRDPAECAPVIDVNTDFDAAKMDAGTMSVYLKLVESGFPKRAVLQALLEGGRLPPDADLDELEAEWSGEQDAQRDASLAARETMLAGLLNGGEPDGDDDAGDDGDAGDDDADA